MIHRNKSSTPIVGGSSLITIFAVLCLVVFAILTLSTVTASRNLAFASHEAVTAYYNADCEAEEIFARLRNGETVDKVKIIGNTFQYECKISNTQVIFVELIHDNGQWDIVSWCAKNTNE